MAIDTAEKRKSAAGVIGVLGMGPGVTPNASQDLEWRQEAGYGYAGIATAGPGVAGPFNAGWAVNCNVFLGGGMRC